VDELADLDALVREALIALESAVAACELLGHHHVVPSLGFERMLELMMVATELLDRAVACREDAAGSPKIIFPCRSAAQDYIDRHLQHSAPGVLYQIEPDDLGRCAVARYQLAGRL